MKKQFEKIYSEIISTDNLLSAWQEFIYGKRNKRDVQEFQFRLADNIVQLHHDLANFIYKHGGYQAFNISDPKPRNIHKAGVRDRVLHHAIYRQLYPFFDRTFIADSYSCRDNKGVHKALNRFRGFGRKVGRNNTRTVWVLKFDIRRFFASIDHSFLLKILNDYIPDENIMRLLEEVIESFQTHPYPTSHLKPTPKASTHLVVPGKEEEIKRYSPPLRGGDKGRCGLPLGNLTSQLFCNVYMNELDQFIKHKLKANYYIRYADDFILFSDDKLGLHNQISRIFRK